MKRLLNRRNFFKCMGIVGATLVLPVKLPKIEPEVIGVDVAVEGTDATVMSLHGTNAAISDDLGGYLVPSEYVDELMGAMKTEDRRNNVFRGMSRTVRYEPSPISIPADPNLLVNNFKRVHQDFAEFLKTGAA